MQGHWANGAQYYRCRFPSEYAVANRISHPLNITLRQDALLAPLDEWLASKFDPPYRPATIGELAAASAAPEPHPQENQIKAQITECDRKLSQYRATLDAGADPTTVARWITETEAERTRYQAAMRATAPQKAQSMTRDEIAAVVSSLSDLLVVLRAADPADKAQIYTQLGLRLTYEPPQPGKDPLVRVEVRIVPAQHWQFESVRGGT